MRINGFFSIQGGAPDLINVYSNITVSKTYVRHTSVVMTPLERHKFYADML